MAWQDVEHVCVLIVGFQMCCVTIRSYRYSDMGVRSDERRFVGRWGTFVEGRVGVTSEGLSWQEVCPSVVFMCMLSSSLLDQRREDMTSHRSDNESKCFFSL